MLALKNFLNFYIHSSIHVGIAVFCLVQLSVPQWNSYSFLVLFGTVVGYNFLKYGEWFLSNKDLRVNLVGIIIVTLIAAPGFLLLFLQQDFAVKLDLIVALVFVLFYPLVRKLGWFKPFFVSFVVSYITVFIPLKGTAEVTWIFLQRFLLLSSVMIPFEILDSTTDSVSLKTLPHLFGVKRTKQIGYVVSRVVLYGFFSYIILPLPLLYLCFIFSSCYLFFF